MNCLRPQAKPRWKNIYGLTLLSLQTFYCICFFSSTWKMIVIAVLWITGFQDWMQMLYFIHILTILFSFLSPALSLHFSYYSIFMHPILKPKDEACNFYATCNIKSDCQKKQKKTKDWCKTSTMLVRFLNILIKNIY